MQKSENRTSEAKRKARKKLINVDNFIDLLREFWQKFQLHKHTQSHHSGALVVTAVGLLIFLKESRKISW